MKNTYIMEHEKKLMIAGIIILISIAIFGIRTWQNRQALRNELERVNLSVFIEWFGIDASADGTVHSRWETRLRGGE